MEEQSVSLEESLRREGILLRPNAGVSMQPLLKEGRDLMVIRPLSQAPRPMDIILFHCQRKGERTYILHRVLGQEADGTLITAGDNCTGTERVPPENVLGGLAEIRRGSRVISLKENWYRLYVALWCRPWGLRRRLLALFSLVRGGISRLLRRRRGLQDK